MGKELYFLPPYSPELNVIEPSCGRVKHQARPIRSYTSTQKMIQTIHAAFRRVEADLLTRQDSMPTANHKNASRRICQVAPGASQKCGERNKTVMPSQRCLSMGTQGDHSLGSLTRSAHIGLFHTLRTQSLGTGFDRTTAEREAGFAGDGVVHVTTIVPQIADGL